ncbi:MAG: DUF2088 domain-containing protein [Bacillota bacterium]
MQEQHWQKVTLSFPRPRLTDPTAVLQAGLERLWQQQPLAAGATVAIPVGSRGIAVLPTLLKQILDFLRQRQVTPYLIAAMGSHGGSTAEGQLRVLAELGITSEFMDCPVYPGVDTYEIGKLDNGTPVFTLRLPVSTNAILLINRVKPHTSFTGPWESGLVKMLALGMGGPAGAAALHAGGPQSLSQRLGEAARLLLTRLPIWGGIAILENAYQELADLVALTPAEILAEEPQLLARVKGWQPRLPWSEVDLLIVEEIGKCFSGTGMDTHVINRLGIPGLPAPAPSPLIKLILVLDLAPASQGNAYGIGLADLTTRQLVNKIDWTATYANALTTGFLERAKLPLVAADEKEALHWASRILGHRPRLIVRIKNTLQLDTVWLWEETD